MRNHRKVKALREKFTNGYAIWVMFLEMLCSADGNVFESTDLEFELLSGDFGVSVTEIRDVVNYCIRLEMLFNKDGFIYSESLNKRLAPVYIKRGKAKEFSEKQLRKSGKFATNNTDTIGVSVTEKPQNKVKKNKVKESILISPEIKKLRGDSKRFFLDLYRESKGTDYYWTAKDSANLIHLLSKVESKVRERWGEQYDTVKVYEAFTVIIGSITDTWVIDNLSIAVINSKFNEIFTQIKNGKQQTTKGKYESSQFRDQESLR